MEYHIYVYIYIYESNIPLKNTVHYIYILCTYLQRWGCDIYIYICIRCIYIYIMHLFLDTHTQATTICVLDSFNAVPNQITAPFFQGHVSPSKQTRIQIHWAAFCGEMTALPMLKIPRQLCSDVQKRQGPLHIPMLSLN